MAKSFFIILSLLMTHVLQAQPQSGRPPVVGADRSVRFCIAAPQARSVRAEVGMEQCELVQGEDGLWEGSTAPLAPGFYYYFINIDGARVCDPSAEVFHGFGGIASGFDIPESGTEWLELSDVPHGQVRLLHYWSALRKTWRPLYVYTPAGYETSGQDYPVLFIQHGGGEDYTGWIRQGRAANILDNLIAEGKATPMLLVCGDSNIEGPGAALVPYGIDGQQDFQQELMENIIPFVERNFRVRSGADNHAMCGLSKGGGQSFYIGLRRTDYFAYVGIFSAGVFGGLPDRQGAVFDLEQECPGILSAPATFNRLHKVFYLSCGEQDSRIGPTRAAVEQMRSAGVNVIFESYPGNHDWQPWRKSFHSFIQKIFR